MISVNTHLESVVLQGGILDGLVPTGTRIDVFSEIYWAFLILGTLVGVVVISYMLWNAYKYRETGDEDPYSDERPTLGELPSGGGKGRKLFTSFALSAIIVLSLITWTYFTLLYVESGGTAAAQGAALSDAQIDDTLEVTVVGRQFLWEFQYGNGYTTTDTLRVPAGRRVELTVTSADVFHNFGVPELRVKSDAIPGQTTETWFMAPESSVGNEYRAQCFELCGVGHSAMYGTVVVMDGDAFDEWYAETTEDDQ